MLALPGNPPGIFTPGLGPNGPGPIDARKRVTTVGEGSSVPYGPTNGYANPNGVTGFQGPAAGSLFNNSPQGFLTTPKTWYVRVAGSNNNGGGSASLTPERSGTDATTGNGTNSISSATANFTSADVGKSLCVVGSGPIWYGRIIQVTSSTVALLNTINQSGGSNFAWAIDGAWASPAPVLNSSVNSKLESPTRYGDTMYIGAGTYRGVYALGNRYGQFSPDGVNYFNTSFNGILSIIGDVTGQYTGDAGMVQLTAYITNDKTAPSASILLNLNGKSNITFNNIFWVSGNNTIVDATTSTSQNISFINCTFLAGRTANTVMLAFTTRFQQGMNLLVDRCFFIGGNTNYLNLNATRGVGSDYDINITVKNCLFLNPGSGGTIVVNGTGAGAGFGNGVRVLGCTNFGGGGGFVNIQANTSAIFSTYVYNCFMYGVSGTALIATTTANQLIENYNLISSAVARTNVAVGAQSISDGSFSPLFHFGQEYAWGGLLRAFAEPMAGSPMLGFGTNGGQSVYDWSNRLRPAGGSSPLPAVGALERSNTMTQALTPTPPVGTHVWTITGPGYQEFLLPVTTSLTTLSIYAQRDTSYYAAPGTPGLPSMLILANPAIGVTAQTVTDTGSVSTWNTLTAAAFTPTANGWITVRIASYDATGTSVVSFADFTVT